MSDYKLYKDIYIYYEPQNILNVITYGIFHNKNLSVFLIYLFYRNKNNFSLSFLFVYDNVYNF